MKILHNFLKKKNVFRFMGTRIQYDQIAAINPRFSGFSEFNVDIHLKRGALLKLFGVDEMPKHVPPAECPLAADLKNEVAKYHAWVDG